MNIVNKIKKTLTVVFLIIGVHNVFAQSGNISDVLNAVTNNVQTVYDIESGLLSEDDSSEKRDTTEQMSVDKTVAKTIDNEDETLQTIYTDGSQQIVNPDGSTTTISADGLNYETIISDSNGTYKINSVVDEQGKQIITTVTRTDNDGLVTKTERVRKLPKD